MEPKSLFFFFNFRHMWIFSSFTKFSFLVLCGCACIFKLWAFSACQHWDYHFFKMIPVHPDLVKNGPMLYCIRYYGTLKYRYAIVFIHMYPLYRYSSRYFWMRTVFFVLFISALKQYLPTFSLCSIKLHWTDTKYSRLSWRVVWGIIYFYASSNWFLNTPDF